MRTLLVLVTLASGCVGPDTYMHGSIDIELTRHKGYHAHYYEDGVELTPAQVVDELESDPHAHAEAKRALVGQRFGAGLLWTGCVTTVGGIAASFVASAATHGKRGNEATKGLGGTGLGAMFGLAIPGALIGDSSDRRMEDAVRELNRDSGAAP